MPDHFTGVINRLNALSASYSSVPALQVLSGELQVLFQHLPALRDWSLIEWQNNEVEFFGSQSSGSIIGDEAIAWISRSVSSFEGKSVLSASFANLPTSTSAPSLNHRQFAIRSGPKLYAILDCYLEPDHETEDTEALCSLIATHLGYLIPGVEWDSLIDPAIICDPSGFIVRWNPGAGSIFGIQPAGWKRLSVDKILIVKENDNFRLGPDSWVDFFQRNAGQRTIITGLRHSGESFPVETDITVIRCSKSRYYRLIMRDVSIETRASADLVSMTTRLSTLIHNLEAGILVEDENRKIALINKHFCNLFKIPVEPEMMLGVDCARTADNSGHMFNDSGHFSQRIQEIIKELKPVIGEELELPNSIFFERDYLPIIAGDTFLGHLWQYRDITHRKNSERALRKATEDAEAASYAKTRFLANMSHEIRTPLNAIVGIIRLLSDTALSREQKNLLSHLNTSSDNLLNIVNDILDFSKIESGQIDLEHSDFDIHRVFRNIYDLNKYKALEKNLEFRVESDERITAYLRGDAVRIQQVLINLLSNALKFTSRGQVLLKNELLAINKGLYRIRFSVEDTGIGISKENQKKIFDSFKQEDESTTRIYGGTGLGLAISSQLVGLMGGKLEVQSRKKEGSTFFFTIELPGSAVLEHSSAITSLEPEADSLAGIKVLLVEDNKFNQFIAVALLEKWGAVADLADNGQSALGLLEQNSYDLILMDVQMPVMDGITATSIIREKMNIRTPILALTANVVKGVSEKCHEAGMNGYVSKPFDPCEFHRKITSVIHKNPS